MSGGRGQRGEPVDRGLQQRRGRYRSAGAGTSDCRPATAATAGCRCRRPGLPRRTSAHHADSSPPVPRRVPASSQSTQLHGVRRSDHGRAARVQAARCTSALDSQVNSWARVGAGRGQRARAAARRRAARRDRGRSPPGSPRCRRPRRRRPRAATAGAWSAPARRTPSPPGSAGRNPRHATGTPRPARRRGSRAGRRSAGSPGAAGAGAPAPRRAAWSISSSCPEPPAITSAGGLGHVAARPSTQPRIRLGTFLRGSLTPRNATYGVVAEAEPGPYPCLVVLARRVERGRVDAVVGHVDAGRVGVEQPDQLVPGGLARHDHPGGAAQRRLDRRAEERAPGLVVVLGLGEERRVVHGDGHRAARRAAGTCRTASAAPSRRPAWRAAAGRSAPRPAGPGGARSRPAPAITDGVGQQAGVPLVIGALSHHDHVRVHAVERAEQAVDVAPDATAVSGNAGGVEQHEGRTTVGHDR